MNLVLRLKLPLRSSGGNVDRVQDSVNRSYIENAFVKYRRGPHRAAGAKLPDGLVLSAQRALPLSSRAQIVLEQSGPVAWSTSGLRCLCHYHFRPAADDDRSASHLQRPG